MRFLLLDFGKGFRKTSASNLFETRYGSEKTVGPQALGPFLDAEACVPTEDIDFKAQESCGRPIEFSAMNFDSFHRLSRRLSPTGNLSLQITSTKTFN